MRLGPPWPLTAAARRPGPSWLCPSQTPPFGTHAKAPERSERVLPSQACAKQDRACAQRPGAAQTPGWKVNVSL